MRRAIVFLCVFAPLALAPTAHGALPFSECAALGGECATLRVPLDRSGGVAGSVDLHVERVKAERGDGVLIALAGGPGQPATSIVQEFAGSLAPGLATRDLILFDQRGSGRSGALDCPELQGAVLDNSTDAAASCAQRLGPRRAFYTTRDSVGDIEALREALGVERITLYGVSYGTQLAVSYAAAHPEHVERLILDSVLQPAGPDPFYRAGMQAVPRILRALCRGRCRAITRDPAADLAALVDRLGTGDLTAATYDGRGRRRTVEVDAYDLFDLIHRSDLFAPARGEVPAAIRSALDGDTALLGRMFYLPPGLARAAQTPSSEFSNALLVATTCEETALPWDRAAPIEERPAQAYERAQALDFEPFHFMVALRTDVISMCLKWPAAQEAPATPIAPLPDVPVLVLNGENDVRTPLSWAHEVAAQFPRARVVTDAVGHSVLFQSECAQVAVEAFFADRVPGACKRTKRVPLRELPTRSLRELRPLGASGKRGRTLRALESTLRDIAFRYSLDLVLDGRHGGLRGGWIRRGMRRDTLGGYVYVPGVKVSGELRLARFFEGELRIGGRDAARGRVTIDDGVLTGRLAGRPVEARLEVRP